MHKIETGFLSEICHKLLDHFGLYYCLKNVFANSFFSGYTQTRKRRKSEEKFWEESLYGGVLFRSWGHGKKWMNLFINWEVFQRSCCLKYTKKQAKQEYPFSGETRTFFFTGTKVFSVGTSRKNWLSKSRTTLKILFLHFST